MTASTCELPRVADGVTPTISSDVRTNDDVREHDNRSFFLTWVLSLLFGFLGADRFYTGRIGTGVLKLLTLGGFGLWWIADLVIVMAGGLRYTNERLDGYESFKEIAWITTGLVIIVGYSMQLDEIIGALFTTVF